MNKVYLSVFGGVHPYLRSCRPDPTAEALACLTMRIPFASIPILSRCPVLFLHFFTFSIIFVGLLHQIPPFSWIGRLKYRSSCKINTHFCTGHLEEMLVASSQSWLHKWERFDDSSTTTLTCWNLNSWGNRNSCGRWQSCFACLEKIERCPKSHEVIHVNLHVFMELQFLPTCAWTQRLQMNINSPRFLSGCFKYFLQTIWLLARLWLRSTAWSTIRATLTSHCNRSLPHCQPSLPSGLHHGGFPTHTFGLQRSDVVVRSFVRHPTCYPEDK